MLTGLAICQKPSGTGCGRGLCVPDAIFQEQQCVGTEQLVCGSVVSRAGREQRLVGRGWRKDQMLVAGPWTPGTRRPPTGLRLHRCQVMREGSL